MAIPASSAYSRFLFKLRTHQVLIDEIFQTLVKTLADRLPQFAKTLVVDGKAMQNQTDD